MYSLEQNTYSLATGARARASTGRRDGARRSLVPTSSCIRRTREAHPGRSAAVAVPGPTRAAGRLGRTARGSTGLPAPRRNRPDPERARTAVRARIGIHCARSVRHGRAVPDRRSTPPRPRPADGAAHFTLHTVRLVTHTTATTVSVWTVDGVLSAWAHTKHRITVPRSRVTRFILADRT